MWKMKVQIYLRNYCYEPADSSANTSDRIMTGGMEREWIRKMIPKHNE